MSDERRELDALFEAGRREMPSPGARRRALERTLEEASRARRHGSFARGWLWLAPVAALLAVVVATVGRPPPRASIGPEQLHDPSPRVPAEAPPLPPPHVRDTSSAPAPAADAAPPRTSTKSEPRPSRPRRANPPPAPSLEAELALLDRARAELARGEPATALASLDDYDAKLKGARLALEARLLRIQALAALGKRGEAARLAREFIARHPDSPLAERARAFADASEQR